MGVFLSPTRAVYFAAYSGAKEKLNVIFEPESKKVHMLSAACAGELLPTPDDTNGPLLPAVPVWDVLHPNVTA